MPVRGTGREREQAVRMGDPVDDLDELLPAHCANAYLDTWDRHLSIAFSNTKGLRNAPGENNCFVNCAVQVFWHLDVFRRSYRRLSGHTCMGNSCIFCALKVIFTQFQYSDKASLHPNALRKALAETFANQQRFQLGHMDDAAECFENILRRLHFHMASSYNEDTCTAPHCLPHQKFSMAVQEKVVCVCGASTSPLKFHEMVHYVSSSALLAQSRADQGRDGTSVSDRFGLLLRRASAMGDVRNCPASCGKQVQKQRTLLNIPDVVSVGLVWDSDRPSEEMTTQVARILGTTIVLPDMFHHVGPDPNKLPCLQLVAVVCYYGKHYSTFVFHSKLKTWIYFDDATVREIGPKWTNVVDKCSRGRFQPLLLLYANDSASPISVDTAPQRRVMAAGYSPVGPPDCGDNRLDRTHDSIRSLSTSSRHSTPNPDHPSQQHLNPVPVCPDDSGRDSPARLSRDHIRQPSFLSAVAKDRSKQTDTAEGAGTLPGGAAAYKPTNRRPLLDGGANSGRLNPMVEEGGDFPDYTLSSGGQYRRPLPVGVEGKKPLPMPPNASRSGDDQRKIPWKKSACGKEMGGVDVVRYQVDPNRSHRGTPDFTKQQGCDQGMSAQKAGAGPFRTAGHSGVEHCMSDREERGGVGSQHVVVKPTPTAHAKRDSVDGPSLTPVQSGLATLPRQRGHGHRSEPSTHHPSGSTHREVAQLSHRSAQSTSSHHGVLPPGTPPPEYDSVIGDHVSHTRQASTSSQASSLRSSVSMGNLHQLGSGKLSENQQTRNMRNDKLSSSSVQQRSDKGKLDVPVENERVADKSKQYIDRRMVETILKHQGVHRNGSSCSNSSVESDSLMGKLMAKQSATSALRVDIPLDTVSLNSLKDSGCGSSDRHSSSSTGSGSVDQFPQYLLNKSMIVPRSINVPHQMPDHHGFMDKGQPNSRGPSPRPGQTGASHEGGPKIMHPIKESSQEDVMQKQTSPTEPIGTQKFILAPPAPAEARPPPIPPKNFAQFQIIRSSHSQSPTPHDRESSLDNLIKEEGISSNFVSLCKKADVLMDRCAMAETKQDVSSALHCGEGALGCLKEAMTHKELNSKAKAYLQRKHNSCLLKVRSLQKRAPASRQESHSSGIGSDITSSVGNRSSITSSDSDLSDQVLKHSRQMGRSAAPPVPKPRLAPHPSPVPHPSPAPPPCEAKDMCGQGTVHAKQGQAVDSKNGYHNSVSKVDGQDGYHAVHDVPRRGSQSQPVRQSHSRTDSCNSNPPPHFYNRTDNTGGAPLPSSLMSDYVSVGSISGGGDGSADLYGTLPRNKSRKPGSETAASAEMYQSFLSKQKSLQAEVSLSQQSLDSVRSDSSDAGNKMNKTQIRQLLQDSIVQRQWHQPSSVHNNPMQHSSAVQQNNLLQQTDCRSAGQSGQRPSAGSYRQQSAPSAAQQRSTAAQKASASTHMSQHQQQRQPHPAGYQHPPASEQTAVPGPKAPPPGTVPGGRPRTPSCQTAASSSNPSNSYNSAVASHASSGTAKSSAPQNVARVMPYSHLMDGQPMRCSGSSYLVMMHPSQQNPPASAPRGVQGYPSTSSLQAFPPASKPLARSASQSDCRTLGNGAHAASLSDQGANLSNTACKKSSSALSVANSSEHPHIPGSHQFPQSAPSASEGTHTEVVDTPVNVRSLLSRFERTDVAASQAPCPRSGPSHPQGCLKRESVTRASGRVSLRRTRSKSESSSTKPKSVLKKTRMKSRPRKSVTFAESIAHFADCDDANSGYESATELSSSQVTVDSRLNCSDDEVRLSHQERLSDCDLCESASSSSDDCPEEEEEICRLCHRRRSSSGQAFCAKCSFYLAKLNLS